VTLLRLRAAGRSAVAVQRERRRLARDLHDGVVQELGWIRSALARGASADEVLPAADRAMAELRAAMSALTGDADESLAVALGREVHVVGERYDLALGLSLDHAVAVPVTHREALVRIAREAVVNAGRHSGGATVDVTLSPGRLVVCDDGSGYDPAYEKQVGFGLTSMRERADAIGARLTVTSTPRHGTCVEVTW